MSPPRLEETEFAPAPIRRGRRGDTLTSLVVAALVVGLGLAVAKPWESGRGASASGEPSPTIGGAAASPGPVVIEAPGTAVRAPTWANIGTVISGHDAWGVRAITLGSRYQELWKPASSLNRGTTASVVIAPGASPVIALGLTFPKAETPLDLRVWLDHGGDGFEWVDTEPVNQLPGLGAYTLLRSGTTPFTAQPWRPGRYRIDALVGGRIRRIELDLRDASGTTPSVPWPEEVVGFPGVPAPPLAALPVGAFAWAATGPVALDADPGPTLDEADAWLDLDRTGIRTPTRSFVGRVYLEGNRTLPGTRALGIVLPSSSTVSLTTIEMLAPGRAMLERDPPSSLVVPGDPSYVAFSRSSGAPWWPGVYALRVRWVDAIGRHDQTWHVEVLPGPPHPEPWLLAATRAWAPLAGSRGILLGATSETTDGSVSTQVQLLPITPQQDGTYPGLDGSRTIGCGETLVRGHPTVIGFAGAKASDAIATAIQYPFYAVGQMPTLSASGAVAGLTLVTPRLTGSFEGPAAYGFRVGSAANAPTYTLCIDMQPPA